MANGRREPISLHHSADWNIEKQHITFRTKEGNSLEKGVLDRKILCPWLALRNNHYISLGLPVLGLLIKREIEYLVSAIVTLIYITFSQTYILNKLWIGERIDE